MTQFDKFVTMLVKLGNVDMHIEDGVATITVEMGAIDRGIEYTGLWGSGTTAGQNKTRATFEFGNLYDEIDYDANDPVLGTVSIQILTEQDNAGLVYTSNLEDLLNSMLMLATNNMLTLSGSEQGMQDINGTVQTFNADLYTMFKDPLSDVLEPVLH